MTSSRSSLDDLERSDASTEGTGASPAGAARPAPAPAPGKRGAWVTFHATRWVPLDAATAWERLVDWERHGDWVPLTRMEVANPDEFVAWSGIGPLMLEDRMQVVSRRFDGARGDVLVDKLGPVLLGQARCAVIADGDGAVVTWHERVFVPYLPRVLAPLVGRVSAAGFSQTLAKMAR
jgi:hypothetical protein